MLIKIEGEWVNPNHIIIVLEDGRKTILFLSNGHKILSDMDIDKFAKLINKKEVKNEKNK